MTEIEVPVAVTVAAASEFSVVDLLEADVVFRDADRGRTGLSWCRHEEQACGNGQCRESFGDHCCRPFEVLMIFDEDKFIL